MTRFSQHVTILVFVVIAIIGGWQFAVADVEPPKARMQWEWKALNDGNARRLDPAEGWELVAVDQGVLYFKRSK